MSMKFCHQCGQQEPDNAIFCGYCGSKFEKVSQPNIPITPQVTPSIPPPAQPPSGSPPQGNKKHKLSFLDAFRMKDIEAELERQSVENDSLRRILTETEGMDIYDLRNAISLLQEQKLKLSNEIPDLNLQIEQKKKDIIVLDDEILLQSFGFFKPRYELQNSELYKNKLEQIRSQQADMVKAGIAAYCSSKWHVNNDYKEGERMTKDYIKLILRSFNNECDASIIGVKFNNIESIEKKIKKAFDILNNLGKRMNISISQDYLNLKLQELYLCYEYQVKKQQEKEEQKRIKEQMREEAKLLKEIEEMKLKIEKEEKHFNKALENINNQLKEAKSESERNAIEKERQNIMQRLAEIEKNKQEINWREQNTRAGYVYVISNLGSFGENVYKIGVTRRLEPEERVDELGDASVPFDFDIHAMIFSDDAPSLENALHKAFEHKRLNMLNRRREFFRVSLGEIENVVKQNFKKPVEFILAADAAEYRQSLMLKKQSLNKHIQ